MLERPPPRFRRLVSVGLSLLLLAGVSSPAWGKNSYEIFWEGGRHIGVVDVGLEGIFPQIVTPTPGNKPLRKVRISFSKKLLDYSPKIEALYACGDTNDCNNKTILTDPPGIYKEWGPTGSGYKIKDLTQDSVTLTETGVKGSDLNWWFVYIYFSEQAQGETFNFCLTDITYNIGPVCKDLTIPFPAPPKLDFQTSDSPLIYGKENFADIKVKPMFTKNVKEIKLTPGKDLTPAEPIATLAKGRLAIVGKISPSL